MKLSKTAAGVKNGVAGIGRSAGQASIQLQQFVGQIQGGQSAMLALSQQSADLGFVLGAPLVGAVVGIGASIIGFLVPSLQDANKETETLIDSIEKLIKTEKLTKEQAAVLVSEQEKIVRVQSERFKEQQKIIAAEEKTVERQQRSIEKVDEWIKKAIEQGRTQEDIQSSITELNRQYGILPKNLKESEEALAKATAEQQVALSTIDAANKKIILYNSLIGKTSEKQEEVVSATEGLVSSIEDSAATYGQGAREVALYRAAQLNASEVDKQRINDAFDLIEAEKQKQAAIRENQALFDVGQTQADPSLLAAIIGEEEKNAQLLEANQLYIQQINELYATQALTIEERLAQDVEANRLALQNKLIDEEQFRQQQQVLAEKYSKDKIKLDKVLDKNGKQNVKNEEKNLQQLGQLAQAAFQNDKGVATGLAVVNTAVGITKALSKYDYAGAALIAVTGAAQIAAINSADSSGGGGTISAPASAPPQQDFQPETSTLELTEQSEEEVNTLRIVISDDAGNDYLDTIANGLEERQRQGR